MADYRDVFYQEERKGVNHCATCCMFVFVSMCVLFILLYTVYLCLYVSLCVCVFLYVSAYIFCAYVLSIYLYTHVCIIVSVYVCFICPPVCAIFVCVCYCATHVYTQGDDSLLSVCTIIVCLYIFCITLLCYTLSDL